MRWAVLGDQGMLGQDLVDLLVELGEDFEGKSRANFRVSEDPNDLVSQLHSFDVWVNCIAFTAVDQAELEESQANLVNGKFPGALALAAKNCGAKLIHISTDYVFDGESNSAYGVDAIHNPKTAYGRSKSMGEMQISESGANYSILRTAWLYGANGRCFPRVVAEKLRKNGTISVVNDQFGQPTWTRDLAEMIVQVARKAEPPKIVHATSAGSASWAEFAKEVALSLGVSSNQVHEIASKDFTTLATRPTSSVLQNQPYDLKHIGDWRHRWTVAAKEILSGI